MNLYTISPFWFSGAVGDDENLESLAALRANSRRHVSSEDMSSYILAFVTLPALSTVMITVTSPPPMHLYAGMLSLLAFLPERL